MALTTQKDNIQRQLTVQNHPTVFGYTTISLIIVTGLNITIILMKKLNQGSLNFGIPVLINYK